MTPSTLNKLLLSRALFHLAKDNSASSNGVRISIACNLLQDAVECFLVALAEHVHAKVDPKTSFEQYFDRINDQLGSNRLPYQLPLIALNKIRVNSKHYGIQPAKPELDAKLITVGEFFQEVTEATFGQAFATLSLVDLLRDGPAKTLLREAEEAFESENYSECLVLCRKVLFVIFESDYNAKAFVDESVPKNFFAMALRGGLHVPYYARDKAYLEEEVKEPTDYIILDHNRLEMELMKDGIDSVGFWNVWRMTPAVYRENDNSPWIVKNDFKVLDSEGIAERAEYVLVTTTDILLTRNERHTKTRSVDYRRYYVDLKRESVPLYAKASKASPAPSTTPPGLRRLFCDYSIEGLDQSGTFWSITHKADDRYVFGFVHEEDVEP
jgi:hypothetical protein